ncbi:hypothetical protein [Spartinivicinus ruber]|uniref:hypothetical protein n=1 Tax=Spartinivicinus ruber TaxID=2683272 RepID=UPI0013D828CE|nr:hypothetical protein [Spartinivicinus ruber]
MESKVIDLNFRPINYAHDNELAKLACQYYKINRILHKRLLNDEIYIRELSLYINKVVYNNQFFYNFDNKPELRLTLETRGCIVKAFYMAALRSHYNSLCAVMDRNKLIALNKLITEDDLSLIISNPPKQKFNKMIRDHFTLKRQLYSMLCEMMSTWLLMLPNPLSVRMKLKFPNRYFCSSFGNQRQYFDNLYWVLDK